MLIHNDLWDLLHTVMATVHSFCLLDSFLEIATALGNNCVPTMGWVNANDVQFLEPRARGSGLCFSDQQQSGLWIAQWKGTCGLACMKAGTSES